MGGSALGDSLSPRWRGAQSRRGITAAGLVIGVLLAVALVSRRHGPGWVASRPYRTRAAAAAGALDEDVAEDVASGRAAQRHIEAREALQQAAGDVGDDSGGGIGGSSDGGGGGVSTDGGGVSTGGGGVSSSDVPKRTHQRSSKASSAAVTQTAGGGTADPADLAWQPATAQAGSGASPVDAADGAADGSSADDGERAEAAAGDGAASGTEVDASEADGSSDDGEAGDAAPAEPAGKGGGSSGGGDGKDQASAAEADSDSGDGGSSAEAQEAAAERQEHTPDQAAADEPGAEAIDRAVGATDDGDSAENGSGEQEQPGEGSKGRQKQAHKWGRRRESRGPIQAELLAAVEAAANDDGAVMLAVTNRDGALFQLPQLLSSLKLVPQEDASRHLVVVCYSAPGQAACRRQHVHCVLDSYETGGLGTGDVGNVDGFAGWGSKQFKGITWRKIQLVQDILLQGFSVLSVDTDIVLFKNPLDPGFNPWMNRDLDIWTGIDNGRMLNCGFYFVRPTDPTDNFMRTWLGRFNAEASDDIWEQAEFNQILKGAHATMPELKWQALDEEWFPDLCFYLEARAVLPDQRQFGELFTSTSDKLDNWDKMFGFHAACCKGGGPALPECKRSITTALMHYQIKSNPSEWP